MPNTPECHFPFWRMWVEEQVAQSPALLFRHGNGVLKMDIRQPDQVSCYEFQCQFPNFECDRKTKRYHC
jgi:hypothetical protein